MDRRFNDRRRASTRHEVDLEARLVIEGQVEPCVLRNLSQGGAFAASRKLPIGAEVTVMFRVPTLETELEVTAVVRWATDDGVGLQFGGVRAREAWALGQYLKKLG